jgi:hypothetical protein
MSSPLSKVTQSSRSRSVTFRLATDNPQSVRRVELQPDFMTEASILSSISTLMTDECGQTVQWSITNGRTTCKAAVKIILFPDIVTADSGTSAELWEYARGSFVKVLGFNLAEGRANSTVTVIQNGQETYPDGKYGWVVEAGLNGAGLTQPFLMDVSGSDYLLLRLLANGNPLGSLYEFNSSRERIGPFFSKVLLSTTPGSVSFSLPNAGYHTFDKPTTLFKLSFELISPITGTTVDRYDLNGLDYIINFNLFHIPYKNYI